MCFIFGLFLGGGLYRIIGIGETRRLKRNVSDQWHPTTCRNGMGCDSNHARNPLEPKPAGQHHGAQEQLIGDDSSKSASIQNGTWRNRDEPRIITIRVYKHKCNAYTYVYIRTVYVLYIYIYIHCNLFYTSYLSQHDFCHMVPWSKIAPFVFPLSSPHRSLRLWVTWWMEHRTGGQPMDLMVILSNIFTSLWLIFGVVTFWNAPWHHHFWPRAALNVELSKVI